METGHDLLSSDGSTRQFVVEIENDGTAHIRFGYDFHGMYTNI